MSLLSLLSLFSLLVIIDTNAIAAATSATATAANINVVFIVVDDLRPEIAGLYGDTNVETPNFERLMSNSFTFTQAYCQVPLCSPSRTSFLTGLRPDSLRVWIIGPYFRDEMYGNSGYDVVTMTQYFKQAGYYTVGAGKIWHPGSSSGGYAHTAEGGADMPFSWSDDYWFCDQFGNGTLQSTAGQNYPNGSGCVMSEQCKQCYRDWNVYGQNDTFCIAPSDCNELCYQEGNVVSQTLDTLAQLASTSTASATVTLDTTATTMETSAVHHPFFVGVGFKRPHVKWYGPQSWFDKYPIDNISIAEHPYPPLHMPPVAFVKNNSEISGCKEIKLNKSLETVVYVSNDGNPMIDPGYYRTVSLDFHRQFRRAYYATISFMDQELGRLLDGLEYFGFMENTVILMIGDHGFAVGELGLWNKHTLFEIANRVPFIIHVPTLQQFNGLSSNAIIELVDVYPTLLDAVGLPPNTANAGKSILYLINNQNDTRDSDSDRDRESKDNVNVKVDFSEIAWTQIATNYTAYDKTTYLNLMGCGLRTRDWRYNEWLNFDYNPTYSHPIFSSNVSENNYGIELYSHSDQNENVNNFNSYENINLAYNQSYQSIVQQLHEFMKDNWPH